MRLTLAARLLAPVFALCVATLPMHAQGSPNSKDLQVGEQVFSNCAPCHGLDGAGGEHAPNIAGNPSVQSMSDGALSGVIRNGIPNRGMPGFGKVLNEPQIHAVLAYLRVLQGTVRTTPL
jgi:mono/diheme cytochrome c family protein